MSFSVREVKLDSSKINILQKGQSSSICYNARQTFHPEKIESLASNIRQHGLFNTISVRLVDNTYNLICGERRFRAISTLLRDNPICFNRVTGEARSAREIYGTEGGNDGLLVNLYEEMTDKEAVEIAVADNVDTEVLDDVEVMLYCFDLDTRRNTDGSRMFNRKEIAKIFNRSEPWVSQTIKLASLPPRVLEMMSSGQITRTGVVNLLRASPDKLKDVIQKLETEYQKTAEEFFDSITKEISIYETELQQVESVLKSDSSDLSEIAGAILTKQDLQGKLLDATRRKNNARPRITQNKVDQVIDDMDASNSKRPFTFKVIREYKDKLQEMLENNEAISIDGASVDMLHMRIMLETCNMFFGHHQDFSEVLSAAYSA